jgi:hypothetical protein
LLQKRGGLAGVGERYQKAKEIQRKATSLNFYAEQAVNQKLTAWRLILIRISVRTAAAKKLRAAGFNVALSFFPEVRLELKAQLELRFTF